MAFTQLFIRTRRSIGDIEFDAWLSESHSNEVIITKNPVEFGVNITDHATIQPKKITIVAEVTDTPLGVAAVGSIVDTVTGLFGTSNDTNLTRSQSAYAALILLQNSRGADGLLTVQTKLIEYTNMLITSIKTSKDKDSANIVTMSINMEEVILVESELVQLSEEDLAEGTTQQQAASAAKKGRQEALSTPDSTRTSILKGLFN